MESLAEEEDENEYWLREVDLKALQAFFLGIRFHPMLASLDANVERQTERKATQAAVANFKAYKRSTGLRELSRWTGKAAEEADFNEDDYDDVPTPCIPERYGTWLAVSEYAKMCDEGKPTSDWHVVSKAVDSLLTYTHHLSWKLDYLLRQSRLVKGLGHSVDLEDLKARHPFLTQCDSHVWNTGTATPLMLSRTAAVTSFSPLYLCVRSALSVASTPCLAVSLDSRLSYDSFVYSYYFRSTSGIS
jgi:hypothetical protein